MEDFPHKEVEVIRKPEHVWTWVSESWLCISIRFIELKLPSFRPDSYSLKTRLALFSVAMFLISVWGIAGFLAYELRRDMEELITDQQRAMADSIANAIGASVRLRQDTLQMTADDITPQSLHDRKALSNILGEHLALQQLFNVALIVTTPDGWVLAEYPSSHKNAASRLTQRGLTGAINKTKRFSIGLPSPDASGNGAEITFGAPIMGKDGKLLGILFGISSLRANQFIDQATDLESSIGYLVVSRSSRLILGSNDKTRILQFAPTSGHNKQLDNFLAGHEGSGVGVNYRGEEELSSGRGIAGTDWVVAVTMPTDDAFSPVHKMEKRIILYAASLLLIVALLTWIFVRTIMRPLEGFISKLKSMNISDSPLRPLDIKPTGPETKNLIDAFNYLQRRINAQAVELSENVARFHFVADTSPILIWMSDEHGRRIWFNQTWLKTTSQSLEQATRAEWIDDIHPDDRQNYLETIERSLATRAPIRNMFRMKNSRGAYCWYLEMVIPRFVDDKWFAGYVGFCIDIDEQMSAQNKAEALLTENRKLMSERFRVEEAERRRMARDLHDDLGQWLTAITANSEAICAIASREGLDKINHCATAVVASTSAIQRFVRDMNRRLGSETLYTLGLGESLQELVNELRKSQPGLIAELTLDKNLGVLDKDLEANLFHLAQEALNNVARHANSRRVILDLRRQRTDQGEELLFLIIDDGIGFDIGSSPVGVGIIGMRERALALGGNCIVQSHRGKGTSIEVRLPLGIKTLTAGHDIGHANN